MDFKRIQGRSLIKEKIERIDLPAAVLKIFDVIHEYGAEAYVVGGCVRDTIIGRPVHDWDICTPVLAVDVQRIFEEKGYQVIPTGLQHGTVTVMIDGVGYEITTFRRDGEYGDGRHPDHVEFTSDLVSDLARRDFTMNAIAYNPDFGFVDPFCGMKDIEDRRIRCVGNPEDRFLEDALRILRAIRFACQLDFNLDPLIGWTIGYTDIREKLSQISSERIQGEFMKMIVCKSFPDRFMWHYKIFEVFVPEWKNMFIWQNNPYHIYNVAQHSVNVMKSLQHPYDDDKVLLLAAMFHDIGKTKCYQDDENGVRHFNGHGRVSADMTDEILRRLRFDNKTKEKVVELIHYHDATFEIGRKYILRWLRKLGVKQFQRLLQLRRADIMAQNPEYLQTRLEKLNRIESLLDEILEEKPCCTLADLKVRGYDVMKYMHLETGREVGYWLEEILKRVIDGSLMNDRDELIRWMVGITDGWIKI